MFRVQAPITTLGDGLGRKEPAPGISVLVLRSGRASSVRELNYLSTVPPRHITATPAFEAAGLRTTAGLGDVPVAGSHAPAGRRRFASVAGQPAV